MRWGGVAKGTQAWLLALLLGACLPSVGCLFSLDCSMDSGYDSSSSWDEGDDDDDGWDDDWWDDDDDQTLIVWDETWIIRNVYDGQTAVGPDEEIELALGYQDYSGILGSSGSDGDRDRAEQAIESIRLYPEQAPDDEVWLDATIGTTTTTLWHEGLEPDTRYVLDLSGVEHSLEVERIVPEPVTFRTGPGPQVTGLWRNEDTLIIAFSEPMDAGTLTLSHTSVDLFWEDGGYLYSVASDLNLAGFVWATEESLFLLAPVEFAGQILVMVDAGVLGSTGAPLDGDGDGLPGEVADDFLMSVVVGNLPECYTRDDVPAPCVMREDVELPYDEDDWW